MLGISLAFTDDVCLKQVYTAVQYMPPNQYRNDYLIFYLSNLTMYQLCATFLFNRTFTFFYPFTPTTPT